MTARVTPPIVKFFADRIPDYVKERRRTDFGGCFMCHGVFVKADESLGCSCQIGYYADLGNIARVDMGQFIRGPLLRYIRDSFKEGYEPFRMCGSCVSRTMEYPKVDLDREVFLHVEPSNRCNLWCEICLCTDERKSSNMPPRVNLPYSSFAKMVREIKAARLRLNTLALVGFGEPLFNTDTPRMATITRELFPDAYIFLDTNANFGLRRAKEIANCGLNEIRLALDGVDQGSYRGYRVGGDFQKALGFTQWLVAEIRATGSPTRALWKYILFDHNDTDEQLHRAVTMAKALEIDITFDYTVGPKASRRSKVEIDRIVGAAHTSANLDMEAQALMAKQLAEAQAAIAQAAT